MRDPIDANIQEFTLTQRPFCKSFSKLMAYGGISPSYDWDDESVEKLHFERARRGKLRLGLVTFSRYADHSFDIEPFMQERKMRHTDLVELVLFARAYGAKLPEEANVGALGEGYKLRDFSNIPWFWPRLQKQKGKLTLGTHSPGRGLLERQRLLVAMV